MDNGLAACLHSCAAGKGNGIKSPDLTFHSANNDSNSLFGLYLNAKENKSCYYKSCIIIVTPKKSPDKKNETF